jgi:hypothetical protein
MVNVHLIQHQMVVSLVCKVLDTMTWKVGTVVMAMAIVCLMNVLVMFVRTIHLLFAVIVFRVMKEMATQTCHQSTVVKMVQTACLDVQMVHVLLVLR